MGEFEEESGVGRRESMWEVNMAFGISVVSKVSMLWLARQCGERERRTWSRVGQPGFESSCGPVDFADVTARGKDSEVDEGASAACEDERRCELLWWGR